MKGSESLDKHHDGEIERDVVLVWTEEKRIITGADILGRLFKGIGHHPIESVKVESTDQNQIVT